MTAGEVKRADPVPNIVLIVSDDHDFSHLGFLGNQLARTPNLDQLAAGGTTFPYGHTMPICRPALAGLLSGRHPHRSGIFSNFGGKWHTPREHLLPAMLARAGYTTYAVGKLWEGDPGRAGFTAWPKNRKHWWNELIREGQEVVFRFLEENSDAPFFLWYAPRMPHEPRVAPVKYIRQFDRAAFVPPDWIEERKRPIFQGNEHAAHAMQAWLDDGVGALVEKIDSLGIRRRTLIVYLIDNGLANGCVSKGSPYEKGVRTPVVINWPGAIERGRRVEHLVSYLDIMPTILDYAGVAIPADLDGSSLRPILDGETETWRDALSGVVYPSFATPGNDVPERDAMALYTRTHRWKYIVYLQDIREEKNRNRFLIAHRNVPYPERDRGDEELYDLANDPDERVNLAGNIEHAETLSRLRASAWAWWRDQGGGPIDGFENFSGKENRRSSAGIDGARRGT